MAEPSPWATENAQEARLFMTHELHTALYGYSTARAESVQQVWEALLAEVRRLVLVGPDVRPLRISP